MGPESIELRIRALKGQNLKLKLQDLHENLDSEKTTTTLCKSVQNTSPLTIPKKIDGESMGAC